MTITTLPLKASTGTQGSSASTTLPTTQNNSAAQNRFLTLLVAQMQAQDPLNPMDNAQMTTQLAQISTVDGVEKLNGTMEKLLSQFGALDQLNATSLIGRSVLVPSDKIHLSRDDSGAAIAVGGYELQQAASNVKIEIRDASGVPIRTLELTSINSGIHTFAWDGKTDAGANAADGHYSFYINAEANGTTLAGRSLSLAHVDGMRKSSQQTLLDLGSYGLRPPAEVAAVY